MKKKIFLLFLIFTFVLTSGFGCKLIDSNTQEAMKPITLNYWRVFDGPDAFDEIMAKYKVLHPYITINYRKLRYNEYEKELLEALAEDRGPDIFSIHNTWIGKYQSKLEAMPEKITMVYPVEKGTIKKETVPEVRTTKSISLKEIKNNYVDAVYDDVVIKELDEKDNVVKEKVYGLPLSVDTLVMYYNRDLMNNAGIPNPPQYWNKEFQQDIKKLTKQDINGQIIQAGVALGGSKNIERFSDILSVLMMQNGARMVNDNGDVSFNQIPEYYKGEQYNPGIEALRFFTDFSSPAKEVFSWNKNLDNSLELFIKGKLAIMFGYAYHLPTIKSQAPKLSFGITKLPQIENSSANVNFANYWVEAVSKKTKNINEAWDFVQFITNAENAKSYITKTKKPTALRTLIEEQMEDPDISPAVEQVLTAKSWYRGKDILAAENIIAEMIDSVVNGQVKIEEAINMGASKVQQTMK